MSETSSISQNRVSMLEKHLSRYERRDFEQEIAEGVSAGSEFIPEGYVHYPETFYERIQEKAFAFLKTRAAMRKDLRRYLSVANPESMKGKDHDRTE